MQNYLHYFNFTLGLFALISGLICLFALALLFFYKKENIFLTFIKNNFLILGFFISLLALCFSLFYSQILNYAPCYLCWLQRIFMFPQVVLFGMAYLKNDRKVADYAFPLLLIGFLIATYQNYLYYFNVGTGTCDPSGVSCVQRFVSEINGLISIPMLSLISFFILIVLLIIARFYKKENI